MIPPTDPSDNYSASPNAPVFQNRGLKSLLKSMRERDSENTPLNLQEGSIMADPMMLHQSNSLFGNELRPKENALEKIIPDAGFARGIEAEALFPSEIPNSVQKSIFKQQLNNMNSMGNSYGTMKHTGESFSSKNPAKELIKNKTLEDISRHQYAQIDREEDKTMNHQKSINNYGSSSYSQKFFSPNQVSQVPPTLRPPPPPPKLPPTEESVAPTNKMWNDQSRVNRNPQNGVSNWGAVQPANLSFRGPNLAESAQFLNKNLSQQACFKSGSPVVQSPPLRAARVPPQMENNAQYYHPSNQMSMYPPSYPQGMPMQQAPNAWTGAPYYQTPMAPTVPPQMSYQSPSSSIAGYSQYPDSQIYAPVQDMNLMSQSMSAESYPSYPNSYPNGMQNPNYSAPNPTGMYPNAQFSPANYSQSQILRNTPPNSNSTKPTSLKLTPSPSLDEPKTEEKIAESPLERNSRIIEALHHMETTNPTKKIVMKILQDGENHADYEILREVKKVRFIGAVGFGMMMYNLREMFGNDMVIEETRQNIKYYRLSETFLHLMRDAFQESDNVVPSPLTL